MIDIYGGYSKTTVPNPIGQGMALDQAVVLGEKGHLGSPGINFSSKVMEQYVFNGYGVW